MAQKKHSIKKKSTTAVSVTKVKSPGFVQIPLDFSDAENARALFSNTFVVQNDQQEFHLLFFQANPPMLVSNDPDREKKLKAIKSMKPQCVARIVVTADRMQAIIAAMSENFARHKTRSAERLKVIEVATTQRSSPKK